MPSVTARELRDHFSPRTPTNYFDVAVNAARTQAARVAQPTHWNTYDAPIQAGRQQTACGEWAARERFSAEPTCPACRQQLAIYDSLQF